MSAITLLVPCYNAATHLPRLIASVRVQSVPFSAILCYDDGSTDNTLEVAENLGLQTIRRAENRGAGAARNRLAEFASTEWIHFHDADDRLAPDFVEKLSVHCTEEHDVISCDADWRIETTEQLELALRFEPDVLASDPAAHLLTRAMGLNNSVIRRTSWLGVGGCDLSLPIWEDADVHIRLALAGARFHHVPEVLSVSLRRSTSFSHDYRENCRCRIAMLVKYLSDPRMTRLRPVLAQECENSVRHALGLGDNKLIAAATSLCRELQHRIPSSRNPLLNALRPFVPPLTLVRWQQSWRARQKG